jgi:hypothetical protein
MAKLLLGFTLMVVSVLLVNHPADAAWWKTKTVLRCVEMTDIVVVSPHVPGSGAAQVTACITTVNGTLAFVSATVLWFTGPDGDYLIARESSPLTSKDLVINGTMTHATLTLSKDSVITWVATGGGFTRLNDLATSFPGRVIDRSREEETALFATVTGTLEGVPFGVEQNAGTAYGTTIFKIISYED